MFTVFRVSFEVVVLPFLAVLRGPLCLFRRTAEHFFCFAGLGALLMYTQTHTFRDFSGIWMCGAISLLLRKVGQRNEQSPHVE